MILHKRQNGNAADLKRPGDLVRHQGRLVEAARLLDRLARGEQSWTPGPLRRVSTALLRWVGVGWVVMLLAGVYALPAPLKWPFLAAGAVVAVGTVLADRWLGRTRSIIVGSVLMTLGHFLMAFDVSFLIALLCLVTGTGLAGVMKAQCSSHVAPS